MFSNRLLRYVVQQYFLCKKEITFLMLTLPLLYTIIVLPFFKVTYSTWSFWQDFLLSFKFEFVYTPILLLILGILLDSREWVIIRRYRKRTAVSDFETYMIVITTGIFTIVSSVSSYVISSIAKYKVFPDSSYNSLFQYIPNDEGHPSSILFLFLFYMTLLTVGLLFQLAKTYLSNTFIAAAIVISIVVLDRMIFSFIPTILNVPLRNLQLVSIILIGFGAVILNLLFIAFSRYRTSKVDYWSKEG